MLQTSVVWCCNARNANACMCAVSWLAGWNGLMGCCVGRFRYSLDGPSEQVLNLQHSSGSCRDLVFETDGSCKALLLGVQMFVRDVTCVYGVFPDLYTVSSDKSLCAIDQNGALAWGEPAAHE